MSPVGLAAWCALANTQGLGPARLRKIAVGLHERHQGAESLVGCSASTLVELGLGASLAEQAAESLASPEVPSDPAEPTVLLSPDDERYPTDLLLRSSPALPVILYAVGEIGLLRGRAIAVAGSRDAHPDALEAASEVAATLVRNDYVVVSGLARGVDEAAHAAALEAGGSTTAVLAEGIERSVATGASPLDDLGNVLVVSQFMPGDEWTPGRAMQRNATIAALAEAVVVVACDVRGGSREMGLLCLKNAKPLFVVDYPTAIAPGNRALLEAGASPLDPANPGASLLEALAAFNRTEPNSGSTQGELFGFNA